MSTLNHHGVDEMQVSNETRLVRRTHVSTAGWISTTQVWSWDGGDAIVVVTGALGYTETAVVIRIGNKVHVCKDSWMSLDTAMKSWGIDTKGWKIQAGAQKLPEEQS